MKPANLSIDELSERWDLLVVRARMIDWGNSELGIIGKQCGIPWFESRSQERVADYLAYDGKRLVSLHSFGRGKIARLCAILTAWLDRDEPCGNIGVSLSGESGFVPDPITSGAAARDPLRTLEEWSVPASFPCRLARFSRRLKNYLESISVTTIGDLLSVWEQQGHSGLIRQKNLGKKTVDEVGTLVSALQNSDHYAVSRVIPLAKEGGGLSLAGAVAMVAGDLTSFEADLMDQRLVLGKTLEESTGGRGLTRERVRQIEARLLDELRERLEYFAGCHEALVESWLERADWFECVRPTKHAAIIKAALEAIFNELPQAVARRLEEENELEGLVVELRSDPDLWFGGVHIQQFLTQRVPEVRQGKVCEYLGSCGEFRFDHIEGKLHPRKTGLFRTTVALLAMEDNPIPATWLIELLRSTGFHPSVSWEVLSCHKYRWMRSGEIPAGKIIWDE